MKRLTILSKIKLLGITNQWQKMIVNELSHSRSHSNSIDKLYTAVLPHLELQQVSEPRRSFNSSIKELLKWSLVTKLEKARGKRLYLEESIWLQQDAVLSSIYAATIKLSKNRRKDITSATILRDVRNTLRQSKVDLAYKTSRILVPYVLYKKCQWKINQEGDLTPPYRKKSKPAMPLEKQAELF